MTIRKTYIAKYYAYLQIKVKIKDQIGMAQVEFKSHNGGDIRSRGTFTTENDALQKALESDPGFNVNYVLQSVIEKEGEPEKETLNLRADPLDVKAQREKTEKEEALSEEELSTKNARAAAPAPEVKKEVKPKEPEAKSEPDTVEISAALVGNVQQAKEYLKNKFSELSAASLANKQMVIEVAKDKGLVFEALN